MKYAIRAINTLVIFLCEIYVNQLLRKICGNKKKTKNGFTVRIRGGLPADMVLQTRRPKRHLSLTNRTMCLFTVKP